MIIAEKLKFLKLTQSIEIKKQNMVLASAGQGGFFVKKLPELL